MKTRIIQDDPSEPEPSGSPKSADAEPRPPAPRNLAARMGRWSARHRKIAIFGWLAFVFASFAIGIARDRRRRRQPTSPARASRAAQSTILEEGFKQPAGESVLIQSDSLRASDPAFAPRHAPSWLRSRRSST